MSTMLSRITRPQMQRIYATLRSYGIPCSRLYEVNARFGTIQIPNAKRAVRVDVCGTVWLYDPAQGTPNLRTPLLVDRVDIRAQGWPRAVAAVVYRMIWTDALDRMFPTTTGATP